MELFALARAARRARDERSDERAPVDRRHDEHVRHDVDTFFTWQHALFYSGLVLLCAIAASEAIRSRRAGTALPRGYALSVAGIFLFFVAGALDMGNHLIFGFEAGFDALLSPTHQLLAVALLLIAAGPLRSALAAHPRPLRLREQMPMLVSAATILELLHMGTNPLFRSDPERMFGIVVPHELTANAFTLSTLHFYAQGAELVAVILQSLFTMGVVLYLVRSFRLRPGALTALLVLGNSLIAVAFGISWAEALGVIVASAFAGAAGDLFLAKEPAIASHRGAYLCFAFTVPAIYQAAFLAWVVGFMGGTWWDPLFAIGTIFYGGLFGLLLSYLTLARAGPARGDSSLS